MKRAIVLLVFVTLGDCAKLPANFKKCNRKQSDFKSCILKAAQDGVSQLTKPFKDIELPNFNPFEVSAVSIKAGTGSVAVHQNFKNCKLYGLHKLKVDKFEFDFANKTVDLIGTFPEIKINAEYKLEGRILLLPVTGEGNSTVILLKNVHATCRFTYDEVIEKEKTYIKVVSVETNLEPSFASAKLENLFDGDKE